MNVSVFIADDEAIARAGLRDMLAAIDWIECVGEAANGITAVEGINRLRPDLVFLDIQMPGMLGLDVLSHLEHQPFVIFTTAYAQHAVPAFELGALDYLLKPFGAARLAATMDRVRSAIGEPVVASSIDRLRAAMGTNTISRIFVRAGRAIIPVRVDTVHAFEALGDYVVAHVSGARHMLHLPLSRLEARLDPAKFARVHRAHIVNLDFVRAFRTLPKGRVEAEMHNGARIPVSRTKAAELRGFGV